MVVDYRSLTKNGSSVSVGLPTPHKRTRESIACGQDDVVTWCFGHSPALHVELTPTDRAVYELIARRYVSQFYPPFEYLQAKLEIAVGEVRAMRVHDADFEPTSSTFAWPSRTRC